MRLQCKRKRYVNRTITYTRSYPKSFHGTSNWTAVWPARETWEDSPLNRRTARKSGFLPRAKISWLKRSWWFLSSVHARRSRHLCQWHQTELGGNGRLFPIWRWWNGGFPIWAGSRANRLSDRKSRWNWKARILMGRSRWRWWETRAGMGCHQGRLYGGQVLFSFRRQFLV